MNAPVCSLWWLLAALLVGWLLCGWFVRQYVPRMTGVAAAQQREILRLQAELDALRAALPGGGVAVSRAVDAADGVDGADNLKRIEGVGPKIEQVLHAAGIRSFAQVAAMSPDAIQALLDAAGPSFRIASPQTWPEQAALAAAGRWAELQVLQDTLVGGRKA